MWAIRVVVGMPKTVTQTGNIVQGDSTGLGGVGGAGSGTGTGKSAISAPSSNSTFAPLESQTAGDGKALVPKGYEGLSPVIGRGTGTGGSNVLSPEQQTGAQSLTKDFYGKEKDQYDASVATIGSLDEMNRNVDILAQHGGLTTPGCVWAVQTHLW